MVNDLWRWFCPRVVQSLHDRLRLQFPNVWSDVSRMRRHNIWWNRSDETSYLYLFPNSVGRDQIGDLAAKKPQSRLKKAHPKIRRQEKDGRVSGNPDPEETIESEYHRVVQMKERSC
jgi:hypothetical protein